MVDPLTVKESATDSENQIVDKEPVTEEKKK